MWSSRQPFTTEINPFALQSPQEHTPLDKLSDGNQPSISRLKRRTFQRYIYKISSPNCFIKSPHLGSIGLPKLTQLQHLQLEFTQMWYSGMWLVRPNLQSDWSPKFCIVLVCDPCMCTQPWYVTLVRYYAQPLA